MIYQDFDESLASAANALDLLDDAEVAAWDVWTDVQRAAALTQALAGRSVRVDALDLPATIIRVGGREITWLHQAYDTETIPLFPLPSHRVLPFDPVRLASLTAAYEHLYRNHPDAFDLVTTFSPVLVWAELRPEFKGKDVQITSSSFPAMPLVSFISDKALCHLPPTNVSERPDPRILAENLLHEAIHQRVNLTLLTRPIFREGFDAARAPKIPIAWRANSVARNQSWELDRTLHAICVYKGVVGYRERELRDAGLPADLQAFLGAAALAGSHALTYLVRHFSEHTAVLEAEGMRVFAAAAN